MARTATPVGVANFGSPTVVGAPAPVSPGNAFSAFNQAQVNETNARNQALASTRGGYAGTAGSLARSTAAQVAQYQRLAQQNRNAYASFIPSLRRDVGRLEQQVDQRLQAQSAPGIEAINRQYDAQAGHLQNDLISRGWGQGTVASEAMRGSNYDRSQALNQLSANLSAQSAGYRSQMGGQLIQSELAQRNMGQQTQTQIDLARLGYLGNQQSLQAQIAQGGLGLLAQLGVPQEPQLGPYAQVAQQQPQQLMGPGSTTFQPSSIGGHPNSFGSNPMSGAFDANIKNGVNMGSAAAALGIAPGPYTPNAQTAQSYGGGNEGQANSQGPNIYNGDQLTGPGAQQTAWQPVYGQATLE